MKIFPGLILIILIAVGCEDMMTKKLDIDSADFPPKLAVSATLDTDSGRFTMVLYEGLSLTSYNRNQDRRLIVKNGTVNLYQDGQLVWTLTGAFDLSSHKYYGHEDINAYSYIDVKDIPAKAGSTYKLEIDMDGYEKAVSTVVMPADPNVNDVFIDTDNPVEKKKVNRETSGYYLSYGSQFYPVKCSLADNTSAQDYYALRIENIQYSDNPGYPDYIAEPGVGVSNLTLIQDNPDYEAEGSILGDGEMYDLYLFHTLLISDITFPGSSAALELFTSLYDWTTFSERPSDYDPAVYGPEVVLDNQVTLMVKHITAETFKHYRSLVLQEQGLGFFAEPIQVTSNVENGYGCFSLQNTRRIILKEYKSYYYPEWRRYYGSITY